YAISSHSSVRPTRRACALAVLVLLSAVSASCGRSLVGTVAPARDPQTDARNAGGTTQGSDAIDGQLVATLDSGVDAGAVATSYGATLLAFDTEERTASFLPATGQLPATLQALLAV